MDPKWKRRVPAIVFMGLASYIFLRTYSYSAPHTVQMNRVEMVNLDGSAFDSNALAGKAVVVNFWAPWCGPCRVEMPWLEKLQKENPGLVVIGVEADPDSYRNARMMEGRSSITFPLVQASDSVRRTFGRVVTLPTTLYISRSGRVVHSVSGVIPELLMTHYAHEAMTAD